MSGTKVIISKNKFGNKIVNVINDDLSEQEKTMIKYEVYKTINESYHMLLKHLPKTDGNKND